MSKYRDTVAGLRPDGRPGWRSHRTVTIIGANDAPTIALSPTAAFTEGTAVTVAPDAVLADVDMGGVGGHQPCRPFPAEPPPKDIPVIFVSGYQPREAGSAPDQPTPDVYLVKPVKPQVLITEIHAVLLRDSDARRAAQAMGRKL